MREAKFKFKCVYCNIEFLGRSPACKKCDICKALNAEKEYNSKKLDNKKRSEERRRSNGSIAHGSTIICIQCNNKFVAHRGGAQKLCSDECKKIKRLEDEKLRKRKLRASAGSKITGNYYKCIICNNEYMFSGGRQKICSSSDCHRQYENSRTNQYAKDNRHKQKERIIRDKQFAIKRRVGSLIRNYLNRRGAKKDDKSWSSILGYSASELCDHLESLFLPGMSWDNKNRWQIDHIIPDSYFKYSSYNDAGFHESWKLSNLQPLWAEDNLKKSNKLDYNFQEKEISIGTTNYN